MMTFHLTLSPELRSRCPEYRGAAVLASVANTPFCEGLWQEIDEPIAAWARTPAATAPRPKPCAAACFADWNCIASTRW